MKLSNEPLSVGASQESVSDAPLHSVPSMMEEVVKSNTSDSPTAEELELELERLRQFQIDQLVSLHEHVRLAGQAADEARFQAGLTSHTLERERHEMRGEIQQLAERLDMERARAERLARVVTLPWWRFRLRRRLLKGFSLREPQRGREELESSDAIKSGCA